MPNSPAASKAETLNGFSGSSVRPIVISLSSFTLASTRGSGSTSWCQSAVTRVIAPSAGIPADRSRSVGTFASLAHACRAIPLLNHARSPWAARPPGAPTDRVHQSPARPRRAHRPVGCPATLPASRHTRPAVRTAAAMVSFHRWIRERRSVGRRARTTGAPAGCAAR